MLWYNDFYHVDLRDSMGEMVECERLWLKSLSLEEMEQIQNGSQNFLCESALSQVIKTAVAHKIERMRKAPREAHPWMGYWLIWEKESGKGVGLIGSKALPDMDGFVEIGYAVAKEFRRKGYMTEALLGFLDWLYEWQFCCGATLAIRSANVPSIRVAEKCGFQFEKMQDIYRIYRYNL